MPNQRVYVGEIPGREATTVAVSLEKLGPPGLQQTLHVVDVTATGEAPLVRENRPFHLWGALVHQEPLESRDITMSPTGGDTLLDYKCHDFGITGGRTERPVKLHFFANEHGRIGCVQAHFDADSWTDAYNVFRDAVSHLLSIWSWEHGVPLMLTAVGGRDEGSGRSHQVYVRSLPVVSTRHDVGKGWGASPAFSAAFSYYREGIGSTSAPYRLLCFYKIYLTLERIRRDFEKRIVGAGLASYRDFNLAIEVKVEASDLAAEQWPETIGWRIGRLADDRIRDLRNRVGHELFDDEDQPAGGGGKAGSKKGKAKSPVAVGAQAAKSAEDYNNFDDPRRWDNTRNACDAFLPLVRRYAERLDAALRQFTRPAAGTSS